MSKNYLDEGFAYLKELETKKGTLSPNRYQLLISDTKEYAKESIEKRKARGIEANYKKIVKINHPHMAGNPCIIDKTGKVGRDMFVCVEVKEGRVEIQFENLGIVMVGAEKDYPVIVNAVNEILG